MILTKEIITHILEFIKARHVHVISMSIRHQRWLKLHLKGQFTTVLMKHGDPDGNHYANYAAVIEAWQAELERATK